MTKAEEKAWKVYPYETGMKGLICENSRGIYIQGYEQAERDLGWHSVEESLPPVDEEVIVFRYDDFPQIAFGHIVDRRYAMDFNGWNIPGVNYWMPMPKLPNEDEK